MFFIPTNTLLNTITCCISRTTRHLRFTVQKYEFRMLKLRNKLGYDILNVIQSCFVLNFCFRITHLTFPSAQCCHLLREHSAVRTWHEVTAVWAVLVQRTRIRDRNLGCHLSEPCLNIWYAEYWIHRQVFELSTRLYSPELRTRKLQSVSWTLINSWTCNFITKHILATTKFLLTYLLTYLLTHSLTPCCRTIFEKLIVT
jgi:hypothetical protein